MSQPPPPPVTPAPPASSNRTLWIVLGSCLGGSLLLLLCGAIIVVGSMTLIGRRVSNVFTQINSELSAQNSNGFLLPTPEPVDVAEALTVGAAARSGDLELRISDTSTEAGGGARPSPGSEFRAVVVEATNRGADEIDLGTGLLFSWVQVGAERGYDCCVFALMEDFDRAQQLAPGATTKVRLVFEVPRGADSLYWVYDDPLDAADTPLVVKLR